ncbi:CAAX prenyl protease-like protein [Paraburkholderia sp. BL23I1N1]|nr:CAAX prenyl protease-like protein [Paraburkholderia sp. BL23I1N1]
MKPEKDFPHAFIDLAKLGRTDWQAIALTILILACVIAVSTLGALLLPIPGMPAYRSLYFEHFSILAAFNSLLLDAGSPVGVFGFWLACKFALRRPFRSLISIDLKFRVRRFLLGAALYQLAFMVGVAAMWLYAGLRFDIWTSPIGHFQLPKTDPNVNPILKVSLALITLLGIAFLAFGEELYMRGWMTQTIGQYIRIPVVVVVLVAVLFAMFHTQYKWPVKIEMFFCALGFSALSLRDRRLELAVGAHSMMNIWVTLTPMFFTGSHSNTHILIPDAIVFALIKGALPFALMYWFLQKTKGWFAPVGESLPHIENAVSAEHCS